MDKTQVISLFVPSWILDKYSQGLKEEKINASVLFLDITGFTSITERLMQEDKEGIEILNNFLNSLFEQIISSVYNYNGFVSSFAGDALFAIYPEESSFINPFLSAVEINEYFLNKSIFKTKFGNFYISVKIGISFGEVNFHIVGDKKQKTFYFDGKAIDRCINSEKLCDKMEIIFDSEMYIKINRELKATPVKNNYYLFENLLIDKPDVTSKENKIESRSYKLLRKFVPENLLSLKEEGEFREITSVFIFFEENSICFDDFISITMCLVRDYGGNFNKVNYTDKGKVILILFGAPTSLGNNIERACNFSFALKSQFKDSVSIGISYGTAYSGLVGSKRRSEYTALGSVVNLSARLMQLAKPGQIITSNKIFKYSGNIYAFIDHGQQKIKGFSLKIAVYELISRKKEVSVIKSQLIGREAEMTCLLDLTKSIFKRTFSGIIYIYGDAGIGKSRLIYELSDKLKDVATTLVFQTDQILRRSLNPIIYFLINYFNINPAQSLKKKKEIYEKNYAFFIDRTINAINREDNELIQELNRIKIFIGSFLSFYSDDPMVKEIEKNKLPEIINLAIKDFIRYISYQQPIIILLEDFQYLDKDSIQFFNIFTRNLKNEPIVIIATSRYNDDKTKPELVLDENIFTRSINLNILSKESLLPFVKNLLTKSPDKKLLYFLHSRTEGNPFYLEQYCLYLKENDFLLFNNEEVTIKRSTQHIPLEINDLLVTRIDRLTEDINETIKIACVLGNEFNLKILNKLIELFTSQTGLKKTKLAIDNFDDVMQKGLDEKLWKKITEINYIFSHSLLHSVVYQMQLKDRLRILHKLAGDIINKLYPDESSFFSEIAYHYENAEELIKSNEFYRKAGDHSFKMYYLEKAWFYYKKTLRLCLSLYGENHLETSKALANVAFILDSRGQYRASISIFKKALKIRKKYFSESDKETIKLEIEIGRMFRALGQTEEALAIYERCLDKHNSEDVIKAMLLDNIGVVYFEKCNYKKSIEYSKSALNIIKKTDGENSLETADIYNNIGVAYIDMEKLDDALVYYNKSINILKAANKTRTPKLAYILNNVSICYNYKEDYDKAIEISQKAIDILKAIFGENHPDIAFIYQNIGAIYNNIYKFSTAIEYLKKSLKIYLDILEPNNRYLSYVYNNLGYSYYSIKDIEKAFEYTSKALKIRLSSLGKDHPETAFTQNQLGSIYRDRGEYNKSLVYYKEALICLEKFYDGKNQYISILLNNIASTYIKSGNIDKALPNLKKAEKIYHLCTKEKNYNLARIFETYGDLYKTRNNHSKARKYYTDAMDILKIKEYSLYHKEIKDKKDKLDL